MAVAIVSRFKTDREAIAYVAAHLTLILDHEQRRLAAKALVHGTRFTKSREPGFEEYGRPPYRFTAFSEGCEKGARTRGRSIGPVEFGTGGWREITVSRRADDDFTLVEVEPN